MTMRSTDPGPARAGRYVARGAVAAVCTVLAQDKLAESVSAYQSCLRVRPNTTDAMMNLGIALVRLDRDSEARSVFADVTRLEPANVQAHVNLAFALANTNMLADSVREFRRAIELEKDPAARAVP